MQSLSKLKLNPHAEEFLPSWRRHRGLSSASATDSVPCSHPPRPIASHDDDVDDASDGDIDSRAKRTVYVGDIDPRITPKDLLTEFTQCGLVKGCRICGDTRSGLRYGFIEFENEDCARAAMGLDCTRIGLYPVRVSPSRPTRAPFNHLPPHSGNEQEKITRTVYCSFIDKMLTEKDLREFFQSQCGEVSCIRLLGDHQRSTRFGFIEFVKKEFAVAAIKCTGMMLGNYRVKVVSSKAPIRSSQD